MSQTQQQQILQSQDISEIIGTSPKTKAKYQQLAQQLQVKVEEIEHPPFEIVDNTDDIEPKPANIIIKNEVTTIHNQIYIQSPQSTITDMKMPMINQQQTPQVIMTTNSSTTNKQKAQFINQQQHQQQQQHFSHVKDQNMLTNSTMNGNSFLPKIFQQPSQESQQQQQAPTQNGYISDYYKQNNKQQLSLKKQKEKSDKNSNQYVSDQSDRRSQNQVNGYQSNDGQNQQQQNNSNQKVQQLSDKKFFRSKIDFMAPIKSLQNRQQQIDPLHNHLSDDSSYYEQQYPTVGLPLQIQQQQQQLQNRQQFNHNNRGPPTIKGSDNEEQYEHQQQQQINHQRALSVSKNNGSDYHSQIVNKYANLTQIQEETLRSTKSKDKQYPPQSYNNSMMSSLQQQQQNNNNSRFTNGSNNYGLVSLNRNGVIGNRKQSSNISSTTSNALNLRKNFTNNQNQSFIQSNNHNNQQVIMGMGGVRSTTNKKGNISMDQGYSNQRNNKLSPLKLPNLKMAQKKESLVSHTIAGHHSGGRLCAVCAKKHNANQPHIVQSIPTNKQKLLQRGPLYLNKSMSRGGVSNQGGYRGGGGVGLGSLGLGLNQNNRSQRSLSNSRSRVGSQSGRQFSLNNSQRSLLGSRTNNYNNGGGGGGYQNNYNQIDRLRSVNKIRTIPRKDSSSSFSRNYKSLSPRVTMVNRVGNGYQQINNQNNNNLQFQKPQLQQQTYQQNSNNTTQYNAMVLTPKKTIGKASFGVQQQQQQQQKFISNPNNNFNQNTTTQITNQQQQEEPELVCREKELDPSVEDEIKDGFFELRQKFKDEGGESSIYVSHVVLHAKHPIFCKLEIDTLKNLLTDSSIIYLAKDQVLYKSGSQDNIVYFVLFGRLNLLVQPLQGLLTNDTDHNNNINANQNTNANNNHKRNHSHGNAALSDLQSVNGSTTNNNSNQVSIGKANIGWTLGEEVLYDKNMQIRQETCIAQVESCLLGIQKSKLAIIQKALLDKGNQKDYFVIESVLKGNFLIKTNWRKEYSDYYDNSVKSRSTPGQSQIAQDEINAREQQQTFLT